MTLLPVRLVVRAVSSPLPGLPSNKGLRGVFVGWAPSANTTPPSASAAPADCHPTSFQSRQTDLFYQPLAPGPLVMTATWCAWSQLWLLPTDPARQRPQSYFALAILAGEIPRFFPAADEHGARAIRHNRPAQHQPGQCPEQGQDGAQCPPSCPRPPRGPELAVLRLSCFALEILERATSSHHPYSKPSGSSNRASVPDGFQEVLSGCRRLSAARLYAIPVHKPTHHKRIHWTL